jgi:hypothetical protein
MHFILMEYFAELMTYVHFNKWIYRNRKQQKGIFNSIQLTVLWLYELLVLSQ